MRLDYVLYGVAVVCFMIAGAFAVANVPGYTLDTTSGIAVTMIFALLGIISGAVGYSARPKAIMPTMQPAPTETIPPAQEIPVQSTETAPQEEIPPPPPPTEIQVMPLEEPITPIASETQMTTPVEVPPPAVTHTVETEQPAVQEDPMKVASEEKPKPTRRRRKKAQ